MRPSIPSPSLRQTSGITSGGRIKRISCSRSSVRGFKQKSNDTTVYKRVGGITRKYMFVREQQKYLFSKETFGRVSI